MKAFLAAVAVLAALGGNAVAAQKKAVEPAPAAEAAPAAPTVTAADQLHMALATYAAFQADIDQVNAGSIKSPADIERAMDKAAALNRDAMTRGFIAYGALTAARNPAFVEEVRKVGAAWGHERVVNGLLMNKTYAATLTGGDKAMDNIMRAATADAQRIMAAGDAVKNRAREAQNLAWGKAVTGKAQARMDHLKKLAAETEPATLAPELAARLRMASAPGDPALDPTSFGGRSFWRTLQAEPQPAADAATATLTSLPGAESLPLADTQTFTWGANTGGAGIRNSMMTVAALYALDALGDNPDGTEKVLNDRITNGCMQGAQLQYYQCVASARFNYENMACIGEAGLQTVGKCIQDATK